MSTVTHFRHRVRSVVIAVMAVMLLVTGFAPAAYAKKSKGKDGADGSSGFGYYVCISNVCKNKGSGNGAGRDG